MLTDVGSRYIEDVRGFLLDRDVAVEELARKLGGRAATELRGLADGTAAAIATLSEDDRRCVSFVCLQTRPANPSSAYTCAWARLLTIEAIRDRNGAKVGRVFGNSTHNLSFVLALHNLLLERGMLEAALLAALSLCKVNHCDTPLTVIVNALRSCDRERLRVAGDPLPESAGDPITAWRGVAGPPDRKRINGVSWSLDRTHAEFFATQSAHCTGARSGEIYEITVPRARVSR